MSAGWIALMAIVFPILALVLFAAYRVLDEVGKANQRNDPPGSLEVHLFPKRAKEAEPREVARPTPTLNHDSDDYVMSKRRSDHLWYGDHSEMDWRDREQGQAWGMDADTYSSNWLEHDPD